MGRRLRKPKSRLIGQVGMTLQEWLAKKGLSKTAAAKRFRQPETYINNRVRGINMTLRSLEKLFKELGGDVTVVVKPSKDNAA